MTKNNKMYQIRQNVKHFEGRTWSQNFWNRMKFHPIPISHEYLLEPDPWNRVKFHPIPGIGWTFTRSQKQMSRLLGTLSQNWIKIFVPKYDLKRDNWHSEMGGGSTFKKNSFCHHFKVFIFEYQLVMLIPFTVLMH